MSMEWAEPISNRRIPAEHANQRRKAKPRPQTKPRHGVVAHLENKRLQKSPKAAPSKMPFVSELSNSLLCSAPPSAPAKRPSSGPTQTGCFTTAGAGTGTVDVDEDEDADEDMLRAPTANLLSGRCLGERKARLSNPSALESSAPAPAVSRDRFLSTSPTPAAPRNELLSSR